MTLEHMNRLLELRSGIGAIVKFSDGRENCFFYKNHGADFGGELVGIKKAMAQLYPKRAKGIVKAITFIERVTSAEEYRRG